MRLLSKIGALSAGCFALWIHAAAAAQPPVEAFGNLPEMRNPQLSPDGKHFAVIQSVSGRPAVVIYTVNAAPGDKRMSSRRRIGSFRARNGSRMTVCRFSSK